MDKACIVAVLLLLAGCAGMSPAQPGASSSVCHRGEVSYPCDADPSRY